MIEAAPRVPLGTRLAYGFGSVAYGIKDNGFAVFLLIFYNQVVGLPAQEVGFAIMIALFVDAFIDPLVGHLSDRTRTRWGRRHPWLYGAALPIAAAWLLLWNPPEAGHATVYVYLIGIAILVRAALSTYEVPSLALLPELTRDYHERTRVLGYRFVFGWGGGLAMLVLAFAVLLVPEPGYPVGQLNPNGYQRYALVGAIAMVIAVLVSAIGTHRRIVAAERSRPPAAHSAGFGDILSTLRFRPFVILLVAGVFAFTNQGLVFALSNYLLLFVWEFPQAAFIVYAVVLFAGVLVAFLAVGPVSQRLGKPRAAAVLIAASFVAGTLPYWLRLADAFPANGTTAMMVGFLVLLGTSTAAGVAALILTVSMMADVTDASEAETGRRTEGLFFAGFLFMQKCVGGIGIFLSGLILAGIGFPDGAQPGQVDAGVVDGLALCFAGATVAIGILATFAYTHFPLGQQDHEARLAQLEGRDG